MKQAFLLLIPFVTFPAFAQWGVSTTEDSMTGKQRAFASSDWTDPIDPIGFPYNDVRTKLVIGCDAESEWAYINFNSPPNLDSRVMQRRSGYDIITLRTRWDDEVLRMFFFEESGSNTIHFQKDDRAIRRIAESNNVRIEYEWFGKGMVYFDYTLAGSSAAITEMRGHC